MIIIRPGTILWKMLYTWEDNDIVNKYIAKLTVTGPGFIPRDDVFIGDCGNICQLKCRVRSALVINIWPIIDGKVEYNDGTQYAYSGHDHSFIYDVGKVVTPRQLFDVEPLACAAGIHGFTNLELAKAW